MDTLQDEIRKTSDYVQLNTKRHMPVSSKDKSALPESDGYINQCVPTNGGTIPIYR